MFRDEDDRTVVTFSPYHDISPDIAEEIYLPGYDVEVSDLSIYGYGTKTVVIRAMWENDRQESGLFFGSIA